VIHLENKILRVTILDPAVDRVLLGPRYCCGGYIRQVEHRDFGPLLSGPEYPSASPDVINGQGAPEVFQNTLFDDPEEIPSHKLVIGVGLVANTPRLRQRESHFQGTVESYCDWTLEVREDEHTATTEQQYGDFSFRLTRSVRLAGGGMESHTVIQNRSRRRPMAVRSFAHPFFPLPVTVRFSPPLGLPENPAFGHDGHGAVFMRGGYDWRKGYFLEAGEAAGHPLSATLTHPAAGAVGFRTDFPPSRVALWANDRTLSLEPFYAGALAPGASAEWRNTYVFPD
jgi:hypothetical protein